MVNEVTSEIETARKQLAEHLLERELDLKTVKNTRLVNCPEWNIFYRSHVQNIGWQNWVRNGQLSGTTGQSLRMEAIQIKIEREIPLNSINQNPFAIFSTSTAQGAAPLTINLNGG